MATLWETMKEKLTIVIVTAAVGIATIFSDKITGSIKAAVNIADQRPAQHEKLAKDISAYVFAAENYISYAEKNLTTKEALSVVAGPYNTAIDSMRNNEYVYFAALQRYWRKDEVLLLEKLYTDVRSMDKAAHNFNVQYIPVISGAAAKADPAKLAPLIKAASAELSKVQASAKLLLAATASN